MKIIVTTPEHDIRLGLPTGLVFGRGIAWLGDRVCRKYAPEAMAQIPPGALSALFAEFRRIKRKHGSWELVEVESSDGENVKIML